MLNNKVYLHAVFVNPLVTIYTAYYITKTALVT